ncbi:unnamed protein product [Chrysoparadoxa australica]
MPSYNNLNDVIERERLPLQACSGGDRKKTICLDLDDTLVKAYIEGEDCTEENKQSADFACSFTHEGELYQVWGQKRPGVLKLLKKLAKDFEVIVFTAAVREYAEAILRIIDPTHAVSHLLSRESCIDIGGVMVKDLNCLNRPLESSVLVDNNLCCMALFLGNGIPVKEWQGDDPNDSELGQLLKFAKQELLHASDVRSVLAKRYKLEHIMINADRLIWEFCQGEDELTLEQSFMEVMEDQ